jgi:hypothetical protein
MWRAIVAGVLFSALFLQAQAWAGELTKAEEFLEAQLKECKTQCDMLRLALRDLKRADSAKRRPAKETIDNKAIDKGYAAIPSAPVSTPAPVPLKQIPFPTLVAANPPCVDISKTLFVRADPLDDFHYGFDANPFAGTSAALGAGDAKGATINYTNDRLAAKQTATIDGRVSYLVFGEQCNPLPDPTHPYGNHDAPYLAGLAVAPFFSSNGTWNEPLPTKLSNSNIKAGSDFMLQSRLENPFISTYLYVSPYYQTDYQNRARIEGSVFALEPVIPALRLDSSRPTPYLSFFWQWRGEVDTVHVTAPGLTNLSIGDHLWIGETVVTNFALFPAGQPLVINKFVEDYIVGRFSLIGTAKTFYDTRTGINADYYTAMLQYKLGECKAAGGSDPSSPCAISGSSSISFEYDTGLDKDTLVKTRQYLVKLGFAY